MYKISAAVIIFFISLIAGALTSKIKAMHWHFHFAETLASGIFLGAAMLHMLPDAQESFSLKLGLPHYPWAHLLCLSSLLALLGIERLLSKDQQSRGTPAPYTPISVLSLHALLEGAALGTHLNGGEALMIFIAIIAHKGLDSFALCIRMQRSKFTQRHAFYLLLIFSLMTPLGIIIASSATLFLHSYAEQLFQAVFNALAAGAFLYLAITHPINHYVQGSSASHGTHYLLAMSLGLGITALLAIWI